MPSGTILVVDDEPDIVQLVRRYLEAEGYSVHAAADGNGALESLSSVSPDVVILDVMLPGLDGLSVCREIRKNRTVPILMLSARGDDIDKIVGLELGADDYMTKPFNPKELVARVRAMFRRIQLEPAGAVDEVLVRRGLKIYLGGQRVVLDGQDVKLTPIEFNLLKVLAANAGRVMSRQDLLNKAWGHDFMGDERTVDVHIRHLREKLRQAAPGPTYIVSVWGVGYKFEN